MLVVFRSQDDVIQRHLQKAESNRHGALKLVDLQVLFIKILFHKGNPPHKVPLCACVTSDARTHFKGHRFVEEVGGVCRFHVTKHLWRANGMSYASFAPQPLIYAGWSSPAYLKILVSWNASFPMSSQNLFTVSTIHQSCIITHQIGTHLSCLQYA